jgi:CheY-like chemotaxis protein
MEQATRPDKTILIVGDYETDRHVLATILRAEGYGVAAVVDGLPAIKFLQRRPAPDLILLDMLSPVCDAWRFLKELSSVPFLNPIPVVILTAINIVNREWARAHGCAGYVQKPVEVPALLAEVRQCLQSAQEPGKITPIRAEEPLPSPSLRVLVVEDNTDSRESLALVAMLNGHAVCEASDGEAALALVQREPPDVAFLDIGLPGMSGNDLARHLRALPLRRKPYLVAVTAYDRREDRARSRAAGFALHLVKPVEPRLLESVMRAVANLQRVKG